MRNLVFQDPGIRVSTNTTQSLNHVWERIRVPVVVPALHLAMYLCIAMSIMLFLERVYMAIVIAGVKCFGRKRYTKYKLESVKEDLVKNKNYPMVLVQIPMFNEKEVYKLSIGAVCGLSWPSDRLIVQVLDDSTNEVLRTLVDLECRKWIERGINVKYETRNNRNGYKAGALKEGLKKQYVDDCEFVVIFDADFQPDEDFLWRTIPYLLDNPELALVQARWKFVNADECLMTRLQEMSLDYHFSVEQEVGSSTCSFFGFNGTAGVWRIRAVNDAGGWKDRTTVEDMDLAVRASLKGWKFVFVGDLSVKNELPSTFKAYRFQQHRWSCGPANLFRKMVKEIMFCERVSLYKKFHLIYGFFFVRKIIAHWVTFFFYCVVIPATILVPEVHLTKPLAIYLPATITILNAACTPRSFHLLVFWILFENVMSLHRSKATIIGLLEASRVNEWVVTEKLGNMMKQKYSTKASKKPRSRIGERVHFLELLMGMYMLHCAIYNMLFGNDHFFIYLFLQAGAFFIVGIGYVGTFVPN
ncbi:glucomannan 4-beta-mannosyltransferase 1-like isoform X1 [Lycium barbarum]|uniref:glucomannan 4-beta-mannosyltransferase 1-like isoform X1 n=1 Tax=Lycium barbarum TaxID=112863 RepID=UPI00293EB91A|nr:glucomannan 4-beta-mannosyltransferase 1-like isoform X1 [Lycium barbarum]